MRTDSTWHTANVTRAGLEGNEAGRTAWKEKRDWRECALRRHKQMTSQPVYNMNRIYTICERAFREEGCHEDAIKEELTCHFQVTILDDNIKKEMYNTKVVRITPHNGMCDFSYPVVVDDTVLQALISANLAY